MNFKKILLSLFILITLLFQCGCDIIIPTAAPDKEPSESQTSLLKVHFLDVGQGDSTFIELPNGETMLIDAAEKSESDKIVTYIFSQGYDTINYVIATHPHSDHIGGIPDILNNFIVDNFYMTSAANDTANYQDMLDAIVKNGAASHTSAAEDIIIDQPDLSAEIVAPKDIECDNLNDTSIVLKLSYKENVFLFTGDAEKYEEDNIWTNIKCDVLKVGHHGSSTSTSKNFLKKTEPEYAVISCGLHNSYRHPSDKTLAALADKGIKTYRTDMQGTIVFTSDGENIIADKNPVEYASKPDLSTTSSSSAPPAPTTSEYVLNTNTKRIHYPSCDSVKKTKDENKKVTNDYESAISEGYQPCAICNPTG